MEEKNNIQIPEPTLRRLPWYLAYVTMQHRKGIEHISSTRIAADLNVESSQIAKDLSYINIKGKTRIGYEVASLEKTLIKFLGFQRSHNAVVIGAGSLGGALMRDSGLNNYGLRVMAGFDVNPDLIGTDIDSIPIYHTDKLADFVKDNNIKVAIITVPFEHAQEAAISCVEAGIRAIWNFTPRRLKDHRGVVIQNTSIYSDLAVMYNSL